MCCFWVPLPYSLPKHIHYTPGFFCLVQKVIRSLFVNYAKIVTSHIQEANNNMCLCFLFVLFCFLFHAEVEDAKLDLLYFSLVSNIYLMPTKLRAWRVEQKVDLNTNRLSSP